MNLLINSVVIIILMKWGIEALCIFISLIWYSRKKAKFRHELLKGEGEYSFKVKSTSNPNWSKTELSRGSIMSFINGINKVSNNKVAKIPFHWIRKFIYKYCLKISLGRKVVIYKGTIFRDGYKCRIEDGTIIGDDNIIDSRGGVFIGNNCNFSSGVRIWTAQHDLQDTNFAYESAPVRIGERCWISSNVTILPGVSIGEGCVIASGAVVTKDCERYGIYGGVPAKKIGDRNQNLNYIFTGTHDFFL